MPDGGRLAPALRRLFASQWGRLERWLSHGERAQRADGPGPMPMPDPRDDTPEWVEAMTPLLTAIWDKAGRTFATRLGLDPNDWRVTNPHTAAAIARQALDFSRATNATSRLRADEAREATRQALSQGLLNEGQATSELARRLRAIFQDDGRALRIADTEAKRAHNAATLGAGEASTVVAGWKWLLSGDACPACHAVADQVRAVAKGQPFAVGVGTHEVYATVKHPPLHPWCACTVTAILDVQTDQHTFHPPITGERLRDAVKAAQAAEAEGSKAKKPTAAPKPPHGPERPLPLPKKPIDVPGLPGLKMVPHPQAATFKDKLVWVDVGLVDASWARGPLRVGPGGRGAIEEDDGNRYHKFEKFLDESLRQGQPVAMSRIALDVLGNISFRDGRHRFAVLRDRGVKELPVCVDKADAAAIAQRFGMTTGLDAMTAPTPEPEGPKSNKPGAWRRKMASLFKDDGIRVVVDGHAGIVKHGGVDAGKATIAAYVPAEKTVYLNQKSKFWADPEHWARTQHFAGYISTPSPWHPFYHESAHAQQHAILGTERYNELGRSLTLDERRLAGRVSMRATVSAKEFIAEVYAARKANVPLAEDVLDLYRSLGGPTP